MRNDVDSLNEKSDVNRCVVSRVCPDFFIAKGAEGIHAEDRIQNTGRPLLRGTLRGLILRFSTISVSCAI